MSERPHIIVLTSPDVLAEVARQSIKGGECDAAAPVIDHETFSIRWKGKTCELRVGKPFKLFERLCRRPGIYVSVEDLIDELWPGYQVERNTVQQTASRLQRRLRQAGMDDLIIDGRKNPGYYALVIVPLRSQ
jgi:DNA-binding response OmpR family regulator